MRLINVETLELESFTGEHDRSIPTYAILSHRWTSEEVSLQQLIGYNPLPEESKGYRKIVDFCAKAKAEGFEYAWIDTCCIDKTSSAELSEAINSMFQWYQKSAACYVYLDDVTCAENPRLPDSKFRQSQWFTRGWTLQELIAPHEVIFLAEDWREIGTKASLSVTISDITKIDTITLVKHTWSHVSVAGIMSWASARQTTRLEDQAYSLMGLFDVNMPLIYGEGPKAFYRLQVEIMKTTNDDSIFAWSTEPLDDLGYSTREGASTRGFRFLGLLAPSPACFRNSHDIRAPRDLSGSHAAYDMVKQDISLSAVVVRLCSLPADPKQLGDIDRVDVVGTLRFSNNVRAVDHGLVITPAKQDAKGIKVMCLIAVLRCSNKNGYIGIPIKRLASGAYQRVENGNRCRWFTTRLMPLRLALKAEDEKASHESEYTLRQFDSESRQKGPPADPPETILVRAYVSLDLPSDNTSISDKTSRRHPALQFRSLPTNNGYYKIQLEHADSNILSLPDSHTQLMAIERINGLIDTLPIMHVIFSPTDPYHDLPPFTIRTETTVATEIKLGCFVGLPNEAQDASGVGFTEIDMKSPSTTISLTEDLSIVFRVRHGTPQDATSYLNVGIERRLLWAEEAEYDLATSGGNMSPTPSSDMSLSRRFTDISI
ncbi:heterokaryon incompatibility protein het-E-1 [Fusarium beomiforme]|uniref:Heterokaryon incompatibility protein het-E-1 n=1 Tax=Fusarium beomiforme TaxID=44412 RepID=A0A9P5AKI8_9HYPO|nr:heterokaryon incompatibility protein het-E-1 [Fusarium beomiforme]